ncbi:MAG: DUF3310 domain-containing protein, partial [Eubacterium sp.]
MNDTINHPTHYTAGNIEVIEYIEDKALGYHLGNVVKYVSREGRKTDDPLEDLKKAWWYLEREIRRLEGNSQAQSNSVSCLSCRYFDCSYQDECLGEPK